MEEKGITPAALLKMISLLEETDAAPICLQGWGEFWVINCTANLARKIIDAMEKSPVDLPLLIRVSR